MPAIASWRTARVDGRLDGHAGPEARRQRLAPIDRNPHADALRHLHEIASRIVGFEYREFRAGCGCESFDAPGESCAIERVHPEPRALAGSHVCNLCFLEVGDHPA